jgi:4-hydroxy-tetrahydrodipicolinate reductase
MRYALVGYGKMGREIEIAARSRGHRLVSVFDPAAKGASSRPRIGRKALAGAEVAFEFSVPAAAEANVIALLEAGVAVVGGTTGWDAGAPSVARAARRGGAGAVLAPNFSVGMALFSELVGEAARRFAAAGSYDPYVTESHHRAKKDAPSGTARKLARVIAAAGSAPVEIVEGNPEGAIGPGTVHVASVRAGHEPGTHTVGFDGPQDVVTLTHRARGRGALAAGAVLAAEWILARRGVHGFEEVVRDLLRKGGRR